MKWLIVAVILAALSLRIWSAIFPGSAAGRTLGELRRRRSRLDAMPAAQLVRSGLLFVGFGALCEVLALALKLAGASASWIDLETPFFAALAGGLVVVGLLAGLLGSFVVVWGFARKMSRN